MTTPAPHAFEEVDDFARDCAVCNLPLSNAIHAPTFLANSGPLLEAKQRELDEARQSYVAVLRMHLRNLVLAMAPSTRYVAASVVEAYDSGHVFTSTCAEGLLDAKHQSLLPDTDMPDDIYGLVAKLAELDSVTPSDEITYLWDVLDATWTELDEDLDLSA